MGILKSFVRNEDGNYAVIFAVAALPIFGAVAISVDYSNLSRLNFNLSDSVDAMCSVVAKEFLDGKTSTEAKLAGTNFFQTNIDPEYVNTATATFILPDDPGNIEKVLKCKGQLSYKPVFGATMALLNGGDASDYVVVLNEATMKMKNIAEVALVLDNSGSMNSDQANNSGGPVANRRITLLKTAAKDLITKMINAGQKLHAVADPVKFSIVPFAASVNVGPQNANASWMDTRGISSIHHENLDWGLPSASNPTGYFAPGADGAKLNSAGQPLTRFSILNALRFDSRKGGENTSSCKVWSFNSTGTCVVYNRAITGTAPLVSTPIPVASATASSITGKSVSSLQAEYTWGGCVESRPNGLNMTDATPSSTNKDAYFVPMFAPDSFNLSKYDISNTSGGYNNWWPDLETSATITNLQPAFTGTQAGQYFQTSDGSNNVSTTTASGSSSSAYSDATWQANNSRKRETNVAKYFVNRPLLYGSSMTDANNTSTRRAEWKYYDAASGPNASCTTKPVTPLTGSKSTLFAAIDAMSPNGNTNVPEGLAWGWRTISSTAPFTEGVPETRKDIDKVVIVLTDGANTYSTISGLDYAGNKSTYASYGYTGYGGNGGTNKIGAVTDGSNKPRIVHGTSASATSHSNGNFNVALNQHMVGNINDSVLAPSRDALGGICKNIKDNDIILMTIGLDLNPNLAGLSNSVKEETRKAIVALKACAGESRSRKEGGLAKKLFWNTCSGTPYPGCTPLQDAFDEITDELSNLRFAS
jgi:Flp pilus assembly protein TadG